MRQVQDTHELIKVAFLLGILARFEPLRAKAKLHEPNKLDDLELEVKAAPAQLDVGNKRVEALQLQHVVGRDAAAASVAIDHNAARTAMQFNGSGVFGFKASIQLRLLLCNFRHG